MYSRKSIINNNNGFMKCPLCGGLVCTGYGLKVIDCKEKCVVKQKRMYGGKTFCTNSPQESRTLIQCKCDKYNNYFIYNLMLLVNYYKDEVDQLEFQLAKRIK